MARRAFRTPRAGNWTGERIFSATDGKEPATEHVPGIDTKHLEHTMARKLQFTIPAPCAWINSNQRIHRMAEANLTKQWRHAGFGAVRPGWDPFNDQVHITAWITKARAGRYDPNNLWPTIKAIMDGVVEAGLLADDDHRHVVGPDMRHGGKGEPCVTLLIESIGNTPPRTSSNLTAVV